MDETPKLGQKSRSMDIFDPSADGITGYPLAQTVQAAREVLDAFDRLEDALLGCMTPLDLAEISRDMDLARDIVAARVEELKKARKIIEMDRPVVLVPMGSLNPLLSRAETSTLRPEQVIQIRDWAKKYPDHAMRTYRTLCGPDAVPQLVRYIRARRRAASKQDSAAHRDAVESSEWDARQAAVNAKRAAARAANKARRAAGSVGGPVSAG